MRLGALIFILSVTFPVPHARSFSLEMILIGPASGRDCSGNAGSPVSACWTCVNGLAQI